MLASGGLLSKSAALSKPVKPAFTLLEMLVVVGIIAILTTAGLLSYTGIVRAAQRSRGTELVHDFHTALVMALQEEESWPPPILKEGQSGKGLATAEVGAWLGKHGFYSFGRVLNPDEKDPALRRLQVDAVEQIGILSPWGETVAKRSMAVGNSVSEDDRVPSGGKLGDHRLRFSVDFDEDGITEVNDVVGQDRKSSRRVRASACVWCCGYDGRFGTKDDIMSWGVSQEENK